ncbi:MAG: sigma-54 dependent transcriptional regulator [Lentisphaeria bacterium]|nr:sigma-54 dependent transcriptional regulator [Lentisphaeria bacterium]
MPMKTKILIAVDDTNLSDVLRSLFRSLEYRVKSCGEEDAQGEILNAGPWDVVVCGLVFGRELLKKRADDTESVDVVVVIDYADLEEGKDILGEGAAGFLVRPVRSEEAVRLLEKVLAARSERLKSRGNDGVTQSDETVAAKVEEISEAKPQMMPELHYGLIIGEHPLMQALYSQMEKVAGTDMSVLIRGESGTGKELVAKSLHRLSSRRSRPFVAINCTAIPANLLESELFGHVKGAFTGAVRNKEGLFQAADGGTLFMDEIGSIPLEMQRSLLRVLQDALVRPVGGVTATKVDVRVLAATNEDLEQRMKDGRFREDLYYRLCAFPLRLPALRERRSDITLLIRYFTEKWSSEQGGGFGGFTDEAIEALSKLDWPGNVRELENSLRRIMTLSEKAGTPLSVYDLPDELRPSSEELRLNDGGGDETDEFDVASGNIPRSAGMTLKAFLRIYEREYINRVLTECGGDKEKAAKMLGISKGTLYRKLDETE